MLKPRAGGPFRAITVPQHTLTIDENGVANTLSIDRATHAPSENTNASVGGEEIAIKGEEITVNNEQQALEGKIAKSERYGTDDR